MPGRARRPLVEHGGKALEHVRDAGRDLEGDGNIVGRGAAARRRASLSRISCEPPGSAVAGIP